MSETREITGPLIRMIRQTGAMAIRMQSGIVKVKGGWMNLCEEGTADILVFRYKRPVAWLETKDPDGTTKKTRREAQAAFQRDVEALGHEYYKVTSIDHGLEALR